MFLKSLCRCALDVSSISIGRVNRSASLSSNEGLALPIKMAHYLQDSIPCHVILDNSKNSFDLSHYVCNRQLLYSDCILLNAIMTQRI